MKNKMDYIYTYYFIAIYKFNTGENCIYINRYFLDLLYGLRLRPSSFLEIADWHFLT